MKVYLLRHGETVYNVEKRYQGRMDIPLSKKGREELRRADICPEVVYVSPLCRAIETAEILFPYSRLCVEDDLREMDFGIFEGRNHMEMKNDPDYRKWVKEGCVGRCPGGETREELTKRTCRVFERLVQYAIERKKDELVILAHGGTQMVLMEQYALPQMDYYHWCGPNAGGYVLEVTEEEWVLFRKMRYTGDVQYIKNEV